MLGFRREGRHWYSGDLDIAVEIPDNVLAGALEKTVTVSVEGEKVRVIGPEDLIVDRLAAAKFRKARSDLDWAAAVLLLHQDRIDPEYLEKAAAREGVSDFLIQAMKKREEMSKRKDGALRFWPRPESKRGRGGEARAGLRRLRPQSYPVPPDALQGRKAGAAGASPRSRRDLGLVSPRPGTERKMAEGRTAG
jgi:hypothetical protein